jgi:hypothetical protein
VAADKVLYKAAGVFRYPLLAANNFFCLGRDEKPKAGLAQSGCVRFHGHWKAAIDFLKRRYSSDWSDRVEVHRKHEGKAVRAVLTPDERRDLAYALLADTDDGPARGPEAD